MKEKKEKKRRHHRSEVNPQAETGVLSEDGGNFLFRESFKMLRTNLEFISSYKKCQVVLVTSAIPNDGKSTISLYLARFLGETGKKVLLLDCDLRKGSAGKMIGIHRQEKGVTTLLGGMTEKGDTSVFHKNEYFTFLPAGPTAPNPIELLGSEKMKELLEELSKEYDYVILDTPPVAYMADAIAVGKYTDGAILVVRHKGTPIKAVKAAAGNLKTAGINILGSVLNQYDVKKSGNSGYGYGYGYGYYGYYGYYGDDE